MFASDLGAGSSGLAYGVLLFANGVGGVGGGVLMEATGHVKLSVRAAAVSTGLYGVTSLFFAVTTSYPVAAGLLFPDGIASLACMSITQTVVQLQAPPAGRGRVVGLYSIAAGGLRAGSGFTAGLLGAALGLHVSLNCSAAALCAGTAAASWYVFRERRAAPPSSAPPSPALADAGLCADAGSGDQPE